MKISWDMHLSLLRRNDIMYPKVHPPKNIVLPIYSVKNYVVITIPRYIACYHTNGMLMAINIC